MTALDAIRRLWRHACWADAQLLDGLRGSTNVPGEAVRELAHIVGAYEVWLSRLEGRAPRAAVWPEATLDEVRSIFDETTESFAAYLSALEVEDLSASVHYTNSAGREFTNSIGDILLHVLLHAQYHRGKVNLLLRQSDGAPAPADYVAFVRGAPAATEATSRKPEK